MTATILIADADPFNLAQLEERCADCGHRVLTAGDGEQVLSSIARERPDVILLHAQLPTLSGLDVLQVLRADPILHRLRVVVIASAEEAEVTERALELGADDVLTHPYAMPEVLLRIEAALRPIAATPSSAGDEGPIRQPASADERQELQSTLSYEWRRAQRYGHDLTCLVLRVANLKDLVAQGGTAASDESMMALEQGLRSLIREVDHAFRSAEGEFTVLLPETGADGAEALAERALFRWADDRLGLPPDAPEVKLELGHATRAANAPGYATAAELHQASRDRTTGS